MIIGHVLYDNNYNGPNNPYNLNHCGHEPIAIILAICEQEHIREWASCMLCLQHEKRNLNREGPMLGGCGHYTADFIYQYIKQPTSTTHYNDWQGTFYDYMGRKA